MPEWDSHERACWKCSHTTVPAVRLDEICHCRGIITVRGSTGQFFIRFLYHMYRLHKTVNMTFVDVMTEAVNKDVCVRVIGKASSYK